MKSSILIVLSLPFLEAFFINHQQYRYGKSGQHHLFSSAKSSVAPSIRRARDLVKFLVEEELCYSTVSGAREFASACAVNAVYEDRFEAQPIVGRQAIEQHLSKRSEKAMIRIDKISDGDRACGFAWTWTSETEEGLRGTTFIELNSQGQIIYVQEIPEPLFKPGDLTKDLLRALTADEQWKPFVPFERRTPTEAHQVAKYLFVDLQNAEPKEATDEFVRLLDENIVYRDFNYEDVFTGTAQVREFVEGFRFPGIEFRPLRFDDGVDSTCFTWEVVLADAPDTVKGISFYELDPESRKIVYVRDVPESAIKPPILGTLARRLRPKLGTFVGYRIGSRVGGM